MAFSENSVEALFLVQVFCLKCLLLLFVSHIWSGGSVTSSPKGEQKKPGCIEFWQCGQMFSNV